ncbi:PREDICTED: uncharacterized protein LOC109214717 [Nicotiana attenuata]|uniref:Transmembrane protein n=1 Tax=Nicotiana attenuata TaxID=49451 RepID=A0A1J6IQB5_NICAT|nr:PREDICTED: uncharacterized protein LOC109214717 [Nicotiana attenuata]OIT06882.1 hypothetical protein A4A49_03223 [Nicotiana attenuata]
MSKLCLPRSYTTSTRPQILSLLMSYFFHFFSFILSHPLYFSYFIFFSPYIIKLLSFLSPLFITTTLLLLGLLTISPTLILHNNSTSTKFFESRLKSQRDDETDKLEECEAYEIVFGTSMIDVEENSVEFLDYTSAEESETTPFLDSSCHDKDESLVENLEENSAEMESTKHVIEEKTLENFFKEVNEFENTTWSQNVEVKKVEKNIEKQKDEVLVRNVHSKGLSENLDNVGISYGSMRKEKEWKRTLACKLFEERHNASYSNSEGMDLLWETHEMDTKKNKGKRENSLKKIKKKGELKGYKKEYDEVEEEMDEQQLCCLQALKFSAGKMNLGMGKPNFVKISKAFRGFGWLNHVNKNNKKVHCGDGF